MTVLQWDQVGERRFETGIDRGVLYLLDGRAVPWNGLTAVNENLEREVKSYYLDGIKYLDHYVAGSYSAKLSAYTYPDELDEVIGNMEYASGVFLHDQRPQMFHLSYRTLVGNDLEGVGYGYKLHVLYNLTIVPSSVGISSIGEQIAPGVFEWTLSSTPSQMFGIRPTSHISFHSPAMETLSDIEEILYGRDEDLEADPVVEAIDPSLPNLIDLLAMVPAGEPV